MLTLLTRGFVSHCEHHLKCYRKKTSLQISFVKFVKSVSNLLSGSVGSMQGAFDAVLAERLRKIPQPEPFIAAWLN